MRLDSVFLKHVVTAGPDTHLSELAHLMETHGVGAVVIVDAGKPVGMVTDRDLALEMGSGRVVRHEPARVVMSTPVETVARHEGIFGVTRRMRDLGVRRLPVVDEDGRVTGMVSLDDLLVLLGRELANVAEAVGHEAATTR